MKELTTLLKKRINKEELTEKEKETLEEFDKSMVKKYSNKENKNPKVALYELSEQIERLDELFDEAIDWDTGEIDSEKQEEAEELAQHMEDLFKNKCEDIIKYTRHLELYNVVRKLELDRLKKLVDTDKKKIESLKNYMLVNLERIGKSKVETPLGKISVKKSIRTLINEEVISKDPRYWTQEVKDKYDKNVIKKLLKEGEEIKGAMLEENKSVNIK